MGVEARPAPALPVGAGRLTFGHRHRLRIHPIAAARSTPSAIPSTPSTSTNRSALVIVVEAPLCLVEHAFDCLDDREIELERRRSVVANLDVHARRADVEARVR